MSKGKNRTKNQKAKEKKKLRKHSIPIPQPSKPPLVTLENADTLMTNFIKYYKTLKLVSDEEWDTFFKCILSPLPFTFRFAENHRKCNNRFEGEPGSVGQAEVMRDFFKEYILPTTVDDNDENAVTFKAVPLATFPKDLVWQCNAYHKSMLGKMRLKKMRTFVFEEERGNYLFKQEVTSMLGPWLVDIRPDDKILELCCAPGLQSAQIAERLHADPHKQAGGFLICNDQETKQLNYRWTIGTNTMFMHENAETFPDLYMTPEHSPKSKLEYDLVFLDAPSSQDGVFRQKADIRALWDMNTAHTFHKKLKIMLQRAVELISVDGQVVYSTASLNPVENEAVVTEILRRAEGSLELVDLTSRLKDFKTRPGMESWKVLNPGMVAYQDYASCPTWFKKDHDASAFPPTAEEREKFQLNRCMRILPHDNDTGGAFYAVIRKVAPLPAKPDISSIKQEQTKEMENNGDVKTLDGDASSSDVKEVTQDGDGQDKKPQLTKKTDEESRSLNREQNNPGQKPVNFDLFVTVTEIDWDVEVTDEALNTETETDTVNYQQPGLKIAGPCVRAWYGRKSEFLFSRFENVDINAAELQFISKAFDLNLADLEPYLMAGVHDVKGTRYYVTTPLVKKIVQSNQVYFQQAAAHAAGFYLMTQAMNTGEMAIQPLLPMVLNIKKRLVNVTKEDLIALLSSKTVFITALNESTQNQLKSLDDKGPVYFLYQPKGSNADPKCPLLLKREKVKIFIEDNSYNKIENCHQLRLCGVNAVSYDPKPNEDEAMEAEEEDPGQVNDPEKEEEGGNGEMEDEDDDKQDSQEEGIQDD